MVDTTAILAILLREPGFGRFEQSIAGAVAGSISAANFLELSIVLESRRGDPAIRQGDALFRQGRIVIQPVTEVQALLARQGFADYGKGRHPAGLNFGDCFACALAKYTSESLLVRGEGFRQTDIQPALS